MRFTSRDGRWCVDLIRLRLTSDNRDGERFRVIHDGYFIAEVATLDELAQHVDLSELEIELSRTHDLQPWGCGRVRKRAFALDHLTQISFR